MFSFFLIRILYSRNLPLVYAYKFKKGYLKRLEFNIFIKKEGIFEAD